MHCTAALVSVTQYIKWNNCSQVNRLFAPMCCMFGYVTGEYGDIVESVKYAVWNCSMYYPVHHSLAAGQIFCDAQKVVNHQTVSLE